MRFERGARPARRRSRGLVQLVGAVVVEMSCLSFQSGSLNRGPGREPRAQTRSSLPMKDQCESLAIARSSLVSRTLSVRF
jgi:hypothetical protein